MPKFSDMFDEPKALSEVSEFHKLFDLPVVSSPCIPNKSRCELRLNLLKEELNELEQAIEDNNIKEIADAFCDLQYVLSGAILEFGLADKFKSLFDEVHRSNMSKACQTRAEADETLTYLKLMKGTDAQIIEKDGKWLLYRSSDGKVMKSCHYSEANLDSILYEIPSDILP